jgi:putative phosphoribosyl transferase
MRDEQNVLFRDRGEAGRRLADKLGHLAGEDITVLALPRGGLPVGYEVAQRLGAPLDIMIVRKLGAPMEPELAMGAIASGGARVLNDRVVRELKITPEEIEQVTRSEQRELERREQSYRGERPQPALQGRTVVLVDDGIATGSTMRVAVKAARQRGAARVIVAVPVAPLDTCDRFTADGIEIICVAQPEFFFAIGQFYVSFPQLSDVDVVGILSRAETEHLQRTNKERAGTPVPAGVSG